MCQAFEAERNLVIWLEDGATIKGFKAAEEGRSKSENPYHNRRIAISEYKAWNHGWSCWHEKLLPWALEKRVRNQEGIEAGIRACKEFANNRVLPKLLKRELGHG